MSFRNDNLSGKTAGPAATKAPMEPSETMLIAGFQVHSTSRQQLAERLLAAMVRKEKRILFFANTNFIVKCRALMEGISTPTCVVVNDGIGMNIAARLIHRRRFLENLNGTDFTPFLLRQAGRPLRVFMIGAKPEVLAKAVTYVRDELKQTVVGSVDGYAGLRETPDLAAVLDAAKPDLVLVAMGNPIQEEWILRHCAGSQPAVFMGVGALFDFWSGGKARAPRLVQALRLEWLFRLALEPRRLMRRYTLDIVVFLRHCFKYR